MALKKKHKVMIGSFSSVILIFMVATGILLYLLFMQQNINYNMLDDKLTENQQNTQSQINILTENLMQTRESLTLTQESVEQSQEAFQEELDLLKASAGEDFSGIIENSIESVVTIRTDYGQGTGFIIHTQGYIVTNAHVLADGLGRLAAEINAITSDSQTKSAEFIGYDGVFDLALLKISGSYSELELGDSNNIQIGEKVIAIGNPLGLQFSVTEGIVSAVHREGVNGIEAYIQTDAALNPGNSGGPLINKQGKVIGINNFKIGGGENLGFALESNYIRDIINEISQQELNQTLIS